MNLIERAVRGSCEETSRLMSEHAEGELRGPARWRVARHLARCERCQALFRALLATVEHLRALGRGQPTPRPEIADLVVERIQAEEGRGA